MREHELLEDGEAAVFDHAPAQQLGMVKGEWAMKWRAVVIRLVRPTEVGLYLN